MFWTADFDDFMNGYPLISFVSRNLTNYGDSHISSTSQTSSIKKPSGIIRIGTNYIFTVLLIVGFFTFI